MEIHHTQANQKIFLFFRALSTYLLFIGIVFINFITAQEMPRKLEPLHQPFDEILMKYVHGTTFDYEKLYHTPEDVNKLDHYIHTLEEINPDTLSRSKALAYWINLYNAATLQLVIHHYPVKSIKEIKKWLIFPPWFIDVVTVKGEKLNLFEIEHGIIRKEFRDSRIHFAINCASRGCPPLWNHAYSGENIKQELEEATYRTLHDSRWVAITEDAIRLTKIFEWYEADFKKDAGSIRKFLVRYLPEKQNILFNPNIPLEYMDYDWSLNQSKNHP
ncbi:MAG: DUF547 domain-containing protein [Calditrichaeota bacterium]|nr:MAG: DUF547 domain-containing protein [Calditrichota bacterium]